MQKKNKFFRMILSMALVLIMAICSTTSAFALSWNGSSTGGGGAGTSAGPKGYAIRTTDDNCIGYRFSVVNKSGGTKVTTSIDIFRNTTYGNSQCTGGYKFTTKYNKKQLKDNQNGNYSTSQNSSNCYYEKNINFASALPAPNGMKSWQNNQYNLNPVLSKLGIGSIASLKNGDKILVEPIYDVRLESVYHALTVTEIAIYGKHILGANSDGGSSSTSASWGFISSYVNKHYPNALYTPDGMGLWSNASALSSRATFYTMINTGYGVGIAYTETKSDFSPNLSVYCCEAWPGAKSTRNNNHYGISYGNSFANWTYGHGYPKSGNTIWYAVNFPAESENCYVKQSVWVVGGGSTSRNVYSNSNTWYDVSLSPTTISSSQNYITVKARVDWINSSGGVLKYGTEKTFYIPIRPLIYRYKVEMIDYSGNVTAYQGNDGGEGCVYVGQKSYSKYTFTSGNSWGSSNNLYAAMHKWSGGQWVRYNGGDTVDASKSKATLSSSSSQTLTSTIGWFRVPDNSGSGKNEIRYKMTTKWASDAANTEESNWHNIPVTKADVQLTEIYLVDSNGYRVDEQSLEVGQSVSIRHKYYNNTKCPIYVEGFNNDGNSLGIYVIQPYSYIHVGAGSYTVPNKRNFSIWGGVYLEGAGIRNTGWETDGTNNTLTLSCKSNHPMTVTPIPANAPYRENTEVITSCWVQSRANIAYKPTDNVQVRLRVYKANGTLITTMTQNQVIVPSSDKNLIYYKWKVPTGTGGQVKVVADIIHGGVTYNLATKYYSTTPYTYSQTPDTQFERSAPTGYSVPSFTNKLYDYSTWYEYAYENGSFVKKNYAIGIYKSTVTVALATGETGEYKNGKWNMKSGYGVSVSTVTSGYCYISGYLNPTSSAYTKAQYLCAVYPEYSYSTDANKCTTLSISGTGATLPDFKSYGKVHFTPLWFPNSDYTVGVVFSDFWTPSGMLTCKYAANSISINGSAYDDHYIGH